MNELQPAEIPIEEQIKTIRTLSHTEQVAFVKLQIDRSNPDSVSEARSYAAYWWSRIENTTIEEKNI